MALKTRRINITKRLEFYCYMKPSNICFQHLKVTSSIKVCNKLNIEAVVIFTIIIIVVIIISLFTIQFTQWGKKFFAGK